VFINHIEGIEVITTKNELVRVLREYYNNEPDAIITNYTVYESIPTTFIIHTQNKRSEHPQFVKRFKEIAKGNCVNERVPEKHCSENIWLMKPIALNQGRGIEIFKNNLGAIQYSIDKQLKSTQLIIQKYIEKPLLYKDRKFDIRVWAVLTWKGDIFYYKVGYIRTSSEKYTLDCKFNYIHLTNNCLQQQGNNYGIYEDGNTISFVTFQNYLNQNFPTLGIDFNAHIVPRMKDLAIDCILAGKDYLNPHKRRNCFELLGFDFMIDEDFRTWLIEVNTNPYLGIPNKFIEGLMPKMLNDLCEITIDKSFRPINDMPKRELKNQFELIYSEKQGINQRRKFDVDIYPIAELKPAVS